MAFIAICSAAWFTGPALAQGLHHAPVVIFGSQVRQATGRPLSSYRVYRNDGSGHAIPIPFQIDEINSDGDYVLDQGTPVTAASGNALFDLQDELAIMGDDIGPAERPLQWDGPAPAELFEIRFDYRGLPMPPAPWAPDKKAGAVYLAIYPHSAPPPSPRRYVIFDRQSAEIKTSRYRYAFDQKNWLVSRRVEMKALDPKPNQDPFLPILDSTTFFMRADLKYFLTIEANHNSVTSELEAFKIGPVRSIVRITYFYTLLKSRLSHDF